MRRTPCSIRLAGLLTGLLAGCSSMLLAGCGAVTDNRHLDGGVDGPAGDDAPDARLPTCWGQPFMAPNPISALNSAGAEVYLRMSSDELTAYFSRLGSAAPTAAYFATRASATAPFGTVALLPITNNNSAEVSSPVVTADGLTLYFTSNRTGSTGMADIWMASRATTTVDFGTIMNVTELNSTAAEGDVYIVPDGSAIYFSSDRNNNGIFSVFRAAKSGATFSPPTLVLTDPGGLIINRMVVSADELTMFYQLGNEIHETHRATKSDAFTLSPQPVPMINSQNADHPTWISPDGCRLYFESDRTGQPLDFYLAVRTPL